MGQVAQRGTPDQLARARSIAGRDGVADGGVDVVVAHVPAARTAVQLGREVGIAPAQLRAEHLREQAVEAVPRVGAVERHEQDVRPSEVAQHVAGPLASEDRIAERAREPFEDRRALEELDVLGRQVREHGVVEVVRHEAVIAAEARDGLGSGAVAHAQRREVEAGGPALRAPHQRIELRGLDAHAGELDQLGGFGAGHDEIARRQLDQRAMAAQAAQAQRRLPAGGEHDLGAERPALGDRLQGADRLARAQVVDVVDDEHATAALVAPRPPRVARAIAATRLRGSSSSGRSATQANGRGSCAAHSSSAVVLPYPAGAETTTSGTSCASMSVRTRRGRSTSAPAAGRTDVRGDTRTGELMVAGAWVSITAARQARQGRTPPCSPRRARMRAHVGAHARRCRRPAIVAASRPSATATTMRTG